LTYSAFSKILPLKPFKTCPKVESKIEDKPQIQISPQAKTPSLNLRKIVLESLSI
jgi:hypothetical protein